MWTLVRRLASCAIVLSLLGGLALPFGTTTESFDADGVHGAIIIPEHINQHFEGAVSNPAEHCVFCHWWQAVSSARPVVTARVAPPSVGARPVTFSSSGLALSGSAGHASPRGPPAHA